MKRWRLINYFDVWGNKEDGYEVNNQCTEFDDLMMDEESTDEEIIQFLQTTGFFTDSASLETVTIEDMGDLIEFSDKETGMPLCRLEVCI